MLFNSSGSVEIFNEGMVKFYAENKQVRHSEVFFNPKRYFDRTLNVLILSSLKPSNLSGLEMCSGSGIRGLRLCIESEKFSFFRFNDIKSAEFIKSNIKLNSKNLNVSTEVTAENAQYIRSTGKYDYIDIDPFGSPVNFLDSAFNLIKKNGILAVSATDTAALSGSAQKACMRKYNSKSLKTAYSNEIAIRILIKKVYESAACFNLYPKPLIFNFEGNFIRLYFSLSNKEAENKNGFVYQCSKCPNRTLKKESACEYCGGKMLSAGQMWLGEIFDRNFVKKVYKTALLSFNYEKESKLRFSDNSAKGNSLAPIYGYKTHSDDVLSLSDSIQSYLKSLAFDEKDTVTYYTTSQLASYFKKPEKKITDYKYRTVLSTKGFRTDAPFKTLAY